MSEKIIIKPTSLFFFIRWKALNFEWWTARNKSHLCAGANSFMQCVLLEKKSFDGGSSKPNKVGNCIVFELFVINV